MKTKEQKILLGLQRLKRFKKLKKNQEKARRDGIPWSANCVFHIGMSNVLIFFLPGILPDPLWALFFPIVTFVLNILMCNFALAEISSKNTKAKNLIYIGIFINILFLLMPFSFLLNPPSF